MIRNTNSSERNPMYLTRKPSELMGTSIPRSSREGLFTPAAGNTDDLMAILPTGDHLAEFAALGDSWGGVTELSSSRMPRSAPTDTPSIGAGEGDVVWAVSVGQ